jgi:hypothetical protein
VVLGKLDPCRWLVPVLASYLLWAGQNHQLLLVTMETGTGPDFLNWNQIFTFSRTRPGIGVPVLFMCRTGTRIMSLLLLYRYIK